MDDGGERPNKQSESRGDDTATPESSSQSNVQQNSTDPTAGSLNGNYILSQYLASLQERDNPFVPHSRNIASTNSGSSATAPSFQGGVGGSTDMASLQMLNLLGMAQLQGASSIEMPTYPSLLHQPPDRQFLNTGSSSAVATWPDQSLPLSISASSSSSSRQLNATTYQHLYNLQLPQRPQVSSIGPFGNISRLAANPTEPGIAQTTSREQSTVAATGKRPAFSSADDDCEIVPCHARGMPPDHNSKVRVPIEV